MPDNQFFQSTVDDPKIWKRSGNELFKRGLYKIALKFYAKAIELNPGFIEAWNNLGLSFLKIGKIEEAKRCNQKVKELKNKSQISQKIPFSPGVEEKIPSYRGRSTISHSWMNDNFWYAFCIAILMGISLTILTVNPASNDTIRTLGFIWGSSILWFVIAYLLLQYVFHKPER